MGSVEARRNCYLAMPEILTTIARRLSERM